MHSTPTARASVRLPRLHAEYRRLSAELLLRAREGLAALRYRYPDEDWDALLGSLASVGNYHLEMNGCLSDALRNLHEREESTSPEHKRRRR